MTQTPFVADRPAPPAVPDSGPDSLLRIDGALRIVTQDAQRRELADASILVRGHVIEAVGRAADIDAAIERLARAAGNGMPSIRRIDASGCVVTPGLINTHHHMYQSLTRCIVGAQDVDLFGWLRSLYPIWANYDPPAFVTAARVAMAELLLSGCTMTSDHQYLFPNGAKLDDTIEAAREMGIRFHACRGAMSVGESQGGLPPDSVVESEDAILVDMERVVTRFHDPRPHAMTRVALAPCSPFSVSRELMRDAALLARRLGVRLHTHLAENDSDVAYTRERFGMTPAEYAEELGWLGSDVWHAHCVRLDDPGVGRFGATRTGVAHCPCSNMRLASGIAPVARMRAAGVPVGLGVDGSASNDSGDLMTEARQAMLIARLGCAVHGPAGQASSELMGARTALEMATRGGAEVLGRDDVGAIVPGHAADLAIFSVDDIAHAGAQHDPVAALVFCAPTRSRWTIVNGRVCVDDYRLVTADAQALAAQQQAAWDRVVRPIAGAPRA